MEKKRDWFAAATIKSLLKAFFIAFKHLQGFSSNTMRANLKVEITETQ
jgi:hypothetical protein